MAEKKRLERVNSLLRNEIGKIIQEEIEFPPDVLIISLTKVETISNLSEAKVFISVMPEEKSQEVIKSLEKEIFDIQQKVNKRLKMKPVPKIKFISDKTISQATKVEEILSLLKNKEK